MKSTFPDKPVRPSKFYRVGCECDMSLQAKERCNKSWIRCNGALKAMSDDMRSRGLDNFGDPLKESST